MMADEQGAQHECSSTQFVSVGRLNFQHYTFGFIFPFTGRPSGHAVMNGKSGDLSNPGTAFRYIR